MCLTSGSVLTRATSRRADKQWHHMSVQTGVYKNEPSLQAAVKNLTSMLVHTIRHGLILKGFRNAAAHDFLGPPTHTNVYT